MYQPGGRLADIVLQQGQNSARNWQQAGESIAGTLGGLARRIQEAPQRRDEAEMRRLQLEAGRREGEAAKTATAQETALRQLFADNEPPTPEAILRVAGPERGQKIIAGLAALHVENQKAYASTQVLVRDVLLGMDALPEGLRAEAYPAIRQNLVSRGIIGEQDTPPQYDPAWFKAARNFGKEPVRPVSVAPGGSLVNPETGVSTFTAPNPVAESQMRDREADNARQRQQFEEAVRHNRAMESRPTAGGVPVVVETQAGPMLVDRKTGAARPVTDASGKQVAPSLSASERMDARKFEKAGPVLASIAELSERINTQQGLLAKMSGGVEKVKAQANYNDDVAEYLALISGFTPLVARSLGHTGVLTQQDVDSVKELFPKPGDSKTLRDRKITRVRTIIGALEATERGKGSTSGGAVTVAAPNGKTYTFASQADADAFKAKAGIK